MSRHAVHEDPPPWEPNDYSTEPPPPPPPSPPPSPEPPPVTDPLAEEVPDPGMSRVLIVLLSAIAGITLVVIALVAAGQAERAEGIAVMALLLGTGLAIGLRRRY